MTQYYYAGESDEGPYPVGPFATIEEAIAEYKSENEGQAPAVIGIGREVFVEVDGSDVIEGLMNGSLEEELYEDALDGWCHFKFNDPRWKTLNERMTKVLHDWLDEVDEEKSWTVISPINTNLIGGCR